MEILSCSGQESICGKKKKKIIRVYTVCNSIKWLDESIRIKMLTPSQARISSWMIARLWWIFIWKLDFSPAIYSSILLNLYFITFDGTLHITCQIYSHKFQCRVKWGTRDILFFFKIRIIELIFLELKISFESVETTNLKLLEKFFWNHSIFHNITRIFFQPRI